MLKYHENYIRFMELGDATSGWLGRCFAMILTKLLDDDSTAPARLPFLLIGAASMEQGKLEIYSLGVEFISGGKVFPSPWRFFLFRRGAQLLISHQWFDYAIP